MMKPALIFFLSLVASVFAPLTASAGDVRVRFIGIEQEIGKVYAALFDSAAAHEAGERMAGQDAIAVKAGVEMVFADLPPGTYSMRAFHDLNGNGELDRSFVGKPKEPYGFSRNARGRFGPPSFDEVSFELNEEGATLEVRLH